MFPKCFPRAFAFASNKRNSKDLRGKSHLTLNQGVQGSTPCGSTKTKN